MNIESIKDFWKANKKLWIPICEKDKIEADAIIYNKYFHTITNVEEYLSGQDIFSIIIYFDQFIRHFERHLVRNFGYQPTDSAILKEARQKLADWVKVNILTILETADEIEILFTMMLFKHIGDYDFIFQSLHDGWLRGRPIDGFQHLSRFYYDTYRKSYTFEKVYTNVEKVSYEGAKYRPEIICDFYPVSYLEMDFTEAKLLESSNHICYRL